MWKGEGIRKPEKRARFAICIVNQNANSGNLKPTTTLSAFFDTTDLLAGKRGKTKFKVNLCVWCIWPLLGDGRCSSLASLHFSWCCRFALAYSSEVGLKANKQTSLVCVCVCVCKLVQPLTCSFYSVQNCIQNCCSLPLALSSCPFFGSSASSIRSIWIRPNRIGLSGAFLSLSVLYRVLD